MHVGVRVVDQVGGFCVAVNAAVFLLFGIWVHLAVVDTLFFVSIVEDFVLLVFVYLALIVKV